MTDVPLFDATRYGSGKDKRRSPRSPRTIRAGRDWGILARLNKPPDSVVHRWCLEKVLWKLPGGGTCWEGGYKTKCGITGRRILVDPGTEIVPCPKCEKL